MDTQEGSLIGRYCVPVSARALGAECQASVDPLDRGRRGRVAVSSERSWHWWVAACLVALAVFTTSLALGAHRREQLTISPLDEQAHYDYVVALDHWHVPRWGSKYQQQTLDVLACFSPLPGSVPDCAGTQTDPNGFAPAGFSYEAQQPPLGYIPYVLTSNPDASPKAALVDARWGGAIWAAVAAVLAVAYAAVEGMSLLRLLTFLTVCLLSPVAIYAESTVTNDAAGVSAGILTLLVVSLGRRRSARAAIGLGLAAGLLIGMLKSLFILAPIALLVADVLSDRPWVARRPPLRQLFEEHACVIATAVGTAISGVAWEVVQNMRAIVPATTVLHALMGSHQTSSPRLSTVLTGLQSQLQLMQPYYPRAPLYFVWNLAVFGLLATMVLLPTRLALGTRTRMLAVGALAGFATIAVAWPAIVFVQGHFNYPAPARYGLPLLPVVALVVARFHKRAGLLWIGLAIPAAAALSQLMSRTF
jgi:hypothetical protein